MGLLGKLESFGKAVWDAGKEAVGIVGDVGAIVDGAGAVGGFIERVGKVANLDDVIEVGGRLAGWAERTGANKFLRAADSPILDGGQLVIAGMKLTTGVGEPDDGDRFGTAGARLHDAASTLRSAQPTESWSGGGADSYAGQNVSQAARTKMLAAADHEVHGVLATEAFQVGFHRDRLDDWYDWLADVGLVTFALGLIPGVGQGLKAAADAHAVLAAVGSSSMELYQLSSEADANAAALHRLVGHYEDVAQTAHLSPTKPDPSPPPSRPSSNTPEGPPSERAGDEQPDGEQAIPPPEQMSDGSGYVVPPEASAGSGVAAGGGSPVGSAPAATTAVGLPATPVPSGPKTPSGGGAPTAVPGVVGAAPPPVGAGAAPMASSMGPAAGIPTALIKEAVQAAMQREAEKLAAEKLAHEEEKRKEDEDGDGKPDEDAERDKRSDSSSTAKGEDDGTRAPVHIEMDVEVARLNTPITITVDDENPIGPPPAPAP
jgi:hypothetical protein